MNQVRRKVLYVITKSNFGGAQKYVLDLATGLPQEFEAVVALGGTGEKDAGEGELSTRLHADGVRTIFVQAFARDIHLWSECRALFELFFIFRRERPEVVHLNSSKAGGLGALAARLAGVRKIVFTVHGLPEDEPRASLSRSLIRLATRLTFALCTDVIVISNENFARVHTPKKHLIYNGAKPIEFLARDEARRMVIPADIAIRHQNDLWLLTNAELHPNKNLLTAIEVVARYNELHRQKIFYVIAGDGELQQKLSDAVTNRRMRETVFLAGFVPDTATYLKAFDIIFLPSKKEGLPYVLLEAGMAELPVAASDVGGIPDIIEDGKSGFLRKPDDVEGFTEAIATLSENKELREKFSYTLLWKIKRDFSFENMLKQTIELY